ncbi:MAG: conjugal transfer protein TraF, partial [Caulobacterales bacterium]|nr:conjugal transfer protein TraF [Caulobacterales bacterium]
AAKESSFDAFKQTVNVGLDLSVAARTRYIQAGLILRNLTSPSFDGPTINGWTYGTVKLRPQATLSEAIIPWSWLTVAVDLDLNAVPSLAPSQDLQRLGLGVEVTPWHVLALRAGAYRNIADGDADTVATLGAGINLWAVRIDAALAATRERIQVDEWNVPTEMHASLGLMADF